MIYLLSKVLNSQHLQKLLGFFVCFYLFGWLFGWFVCWFLPWGMISWQEPINWYQKPEITRMVSLTPFSPSSLSVIFKLLSLKIKYYLNSPTNHLEMSRQESHQRHHARFCSTVHWLSLYWYSRHARAHTQVFRLPTNWPKVAMETINASAFLDVRITHN